MSDWHPLQLKIVKAQDATGATDWTNSRGAMKMILHIHVDAVGAAPSATIKVQGVNMIASRAATAAVTPKDLSSTVVIATGDTYVEINGYLTGVFLPMSTIRINVSANVDVELQAELYGA